MYSLEERKHQKLVNVLGKGK